MPRRAPRGAVPRHAAGWDDAARQTSPDGHGADLRPLRRYRTARLTSHVRRCDSRHRSPRPPQRHRRWTSRHTVVTRSRPTGPDRLRYARGPAAGRPSADYYMHVYCSGANKAATNSAARAYCIVRAPGGALGGVRTRAERQAAYDSTARPAVRRMTRTHGPKPGSAPRVAPDVPGPARTRSRAQAPITQHRALQQAHALDDALEPRRHRLRPRLARAEVHV